MVFLSRRMPRGTVYAFVIKGLTGREAG